MYISIRAVKKNMEEKGIKAKDIQVRDYAGWSDTFCDSLDDLYRLETKVRELFEKEE